MAKRYTAADLVGLLSQRYSLPKHVGIAEAPNTNLSPKRCDYLAIGVWGSAETIGHEIKVSRSDWMSELQDPTKAEAFSDYCDRWYIVAPAGIVKHEELTAGWGLMEPAGSGLRIRRQATKAKDVPPMPSEMQAAILRRAVQNAAKPHEAEQRAAVKAAVEADRALAKDVSRNELDSLRRGQKRTNDALNEFVRLTGINPLHHQNAGGERLKLAGDVVKALLGSDYEWLRGQLRRQRERLSRDAESVSHLLGVLEE